MAVDLAQSALGDLSGSRVLVIGAGCMAESTTRALVQRGVREVVVANRTAAAARALAATVGGRGVALDCLPAELVSADIVISSTDAPGVILRHADLALAMAERTNRPMVVIDIAVPRDVDVAAADLPSVSLFDIDDLASVVAANLNGRRVEADRGEALVADAVSGFSAWRRGLSAAPVIASMRARAEAIRRGEVERLADQWEELSDADRRRVDALTKRIVNTLLHEPTVRAQAAAEGSEGEAQRHIESLRYLFGAVPRSLEGLDAAS